MKKLLIALTALGVALALAPASFGAPCADCDPGGGGGGGGGGNAAPTAAFTSGPASPQTFDTVTFTNSSSDSDGSIASSSWDFGDGGTSTDSSPQHAYANGGTYNVTLTVTDNNGATGNVTHQVTVSNRMPSASFSVNPVVQPHQDIVLVNHSTDPEGHMASYEWTFGDGTGSTAVNPSKNYSSPGSYQVVLKVTDDKGAWSFTSKNVRVNAAPTAAIVVGTGQTAGVAAGFDSTAQDGDGSVASYSWDFGDGAQGTGAAPSHTYPAAGDYKVQLTVTDNDGATGHAEITVHVAAAPAQPGGDQTGGGDSNTGGGSTRGSTTGSTGTSADPAPGGPLAGSGADKTAPALVVPATLKAKKKAGKLVYTVGTDEAATIVAQLKGKVAGKATVKIAKAGNGKVTIKLSSKAKKALKAAKNVKLTLVTTATDAAGNKTTRTTRVTLV